LAAGAAVAVKLGGTYEQVRFEGSWADLRALVNPPPPAAVEKPHTSLQLRRAVWLNTLSMVKEAPWLGVGLGNQKVQYPRFTRAAAVDPVFSASYQIDHVHQDYLQSLAELGLVGLALEGWLGFAIWRVWRRGWQHAPPGARMLVLGLGLGMVGVLIDAAFSFPFEQALPPALFLAYAGLLAVLAPPHPPPALAWRTFVLAPGRAWRTMVTATTAAAVALIALTLLEKEWIVADRHAYLMIRAQNRGDWLQAAAEAEAVRAHNPRRAEPLITLGGAALALGQPERAVIVLRQLLEAYPYDMNALGTLGLAYRALGREVEALHAFRTVEGIAPKDPVARYSAGELLDRQGRLPEALAEYRLAVEYAPGNALYYHAWGVAAMRLGRAAEAREALLRAIELDPSRAVSHKALGVLLSEIVGDRVEGARHLRRALDLDPNDRDAPRIRQILGHADGGGR
jgi:tetratricopeptide (TPR) repeat protein